MFVKMPREQSWSMQDENNAMLVDYMHFWVVSKYTQWTASPEETGEVSKRRKRGEKPPPIPLIYPVANRPPVAHAAALARYEALSQQYPSAARSAPADGDEEDLDVLPSNPTPRELYAHMTRLHQQ